MLLMTFDIYVKGRHSAHFRRRISLPLKSKKSVKHLRSWTEGVHFIEYMVPVRAGRRDFNNCCARKTNRINNGTSIPTYKLIWAYLADRISLIIIFCSNNAWVSLGYANIFNNNVGQYFIRAPAQRSYSTCWVPCHLHVVSMIRTSSSVKVASSFC
jgi:hypothetical protein